MLTVLASIPSPPWRSLGPFQAYGLMIAIGVLLGVELARRRFAGKGGDPDDFSNIAVWAVPAGLVGSRVYHVVTDYQRFTDDWVDVFRIREGGLGIPGGLLFGVAVGVFMGRRKGISLPVGLDCVAPGLAVAQAVGRLGNWFNQELYGSASSLPWAVEIDAQYAPDNVAGTFHPVFLYEGLWNLTLAWVLIKLDNRKVLRPGSIFALYVMGYAMIRFILEFVRVDEATQLLGLRVNIWVSGVAFGLALLALVLRRGERSSEEREPYPGRDHTSLDDDLAEPEPRRVSRGG